MGKPPQSPYPPDLVEGTAPPVELDDLVDAALENVDAANSRRPRLALHRTAVRLCRLTGSDLAESSLTDVTFDECRLDLVGLRFAKLQRVVFRDCRMNECDFYAASLKDVLFERCDLGEAVFSSATIARIELRGCGLQGARGLEALEGARMPWNDVLENGPAFGAALGIEILE